MAKKNERSTNEQQGLFDRPVYSAPDDLEDGYTLDAIGLEDIDPNAQRLSDVFDDEPIQPDAAQPASDQTRPLDMITSEFTDYNTAPLGTVPIAPVEDALDAVFEEEPVEELPEEDEQEQIYNTAPLDPVYPAAESAAAAETGTEQHSPGFFREHRMGMIIAAIILAAAACFIWFVFYAGQSAKQSSDALLQQLTPTTTTTNKKNSASTTVSPTNTDKNTTTTTDDLKKPVNSDSNSQNQNNQNTVTPTPPTDQGSQTTPDNSGTGSTTDNSGTGSGTSDGSGTGGSTDNSGSGGSTDNSGSGGSTDNSGSGGSTDNSGNSGNNNSGNDHADD